MTHDDVHFDGECPTCGQACQCAAAIAWVSIKNTFPKRRQHILMTVSGFPEVQIGWWDGLRFCRWNCGSAEEAMFMVTHWASVTLPEPAEQRWEDIFDIWEKGGRKLPPLRLFDQDRENMLDRLKLIKIYAEEAKINASEGPVDGRNLIAATRLQNIRMSMVFMLEKLPYLSMMLEREP